MSGRGRPPKPEDERLRPLTTNLPDDVYDSLCRVARVRDVTPAREARDRLRRSLREDGLLEFRK